MLKNLNNYLRILKLRIGALVRTRKERAVWSFGKIMMMQKSMSEHGKPFRMDAYPHHPLHEVCLAQFIKDIESFAENQKDPLKRIHGGITISFTDSICAIPGKDLTEIDLHFGISGSGGLNTLEMAEAIKPHLDEHGIKVAYIVEGCDIGNMLLGHWDYGVAIEAARTVHSGTRKLYPGAKILRYGLPPTLDEYLETCFWKSEMDLLQICQDDPEYNSVFISLHKLGNAKIPQQADGKNSAEGVHLSQSGVLELNEKFADAKMKSPMIGYVE